MKRLLFLVLTSSIWMLFTCNNSNDKKTETATQPEETVAAPDAIPAAFFKVIMLQHKVKNFPAWKAEYMSHDSMRQLYGVTHFAFGRAMEDCMVIVIDKVTEGQKAKDFADLPKLKENMKKAGVIGVPVVSFADVVRNDDAKIELKDRLMVIHKVAVSDMEKAKARIASEDLKKIMTDAGVEGVPFFYYRLVDQGKPG